jgi:AraC family transcriptional regulator, regulatory protein of adaptative response / methylated-DNA-[protein]-cysteine methyltransferase
MQESIGKYQQLSEDYARIEQAILYIEQNFRRQPELHEVAESVHLSEYHFQRLFNRWVGISPKRFLQFLTKESAKRMLENAASVLDASLESGLSGPGRLHDLFITCEAVSPGQYKNLGDGLDISYGFHPTPFGEALIAVTEKGICSLQFVTTGRPKALQQLHTQWRKARLVEDKQSTASLLERIFSPSWKPLPGQLSLHLAGTNFQIKVWEALLRIPPGSVVSYEGLVAWLGMPGGARAVGNAVGKNPVAYLIPCHRVIRKVGEFGGYAGGAARKKAMLGFELAAGD